MRLAQREQRMAALKRLGAFFGVSGLALLAILFPYILRGHFLVWEIDGVLQHLPFLQYIKKHGAFRLGGFDYTIGLGADYSQALAYYSLFDPVTLLLYAMPHISMPLAYSVLVCVKLLLTGTCMYAYMRARKVQQTISVAIGVAYMLCGYAMFSFFRHPDLCAGVTYAPLVMLGLEKAIDKKSPLLLIFSVFVLTVSSFYMAYMVTLYALAYAVLYYLHQAKTRGETFACKTFVLTFLRVAGCYLLGLTLASFVLLPVASAYLNGARSAGKGFRFYSLLELLIQACVFFVPVPGNTYTAIMFNVVTLFLACAAFATRSRSPYGKMTVLLSAGIFLSGMGYGMNLFNYASNRFCYLLSFSAYSLIGLQFAHREEDTPTVRECNFAIRGMLGFVLLPVTFASWVLVEFCVRKGNVVLVLLAAIFSCVLLAGGIFGIRKLASHDFSFARLRKKATFRRIFSVFTAACLLYAVGFHCVYSLQHADGTLLSAQTSKAEQYVAANQTDTFTRLDASFNGSFNNRPTYNGYRGTSCYNSLVPASIREFCIANNLIAMPDTLGMWGVNGRMALQALLCVNRYYALEGEYVPEQFVESNVEQLYETDEYIRFGTVFSDTMSESVFYALPEVERQYAALTAVVTKDGKNGTYAPLAAVVDSEMPKDVMLQAGEVVTIRFSVAADSETYVAFSFAEYRNGRLGIEAGHTNTTIETYERGYQFFSERKSFLIKLDPAVSEVKLKSGFTQSVGIQDVCLYSASTRAVRERIRTASAFAHLTDTKFTQDGFSGTVDSEGGTMLIPLPYSDCWTASVDGNAVSIARADAAFMSIPVSAGKHEIVFTYKTPLRTTALVVTILSFALVVAIGVVQVALAIKRR